MRESQRSRKQLQEATSMQKHTHTCACVCVCVCVSHSSKQFLYGNGSPHLPNPPQEKHMEKKSLLEEGQPVCFALKNRKGKKPNKPRLTLPAFRAGSGQPFPQQRQYMLFLTLRWEGHIPGPANTADSCP